MSSYVLYTLRDLRIDGERQAERALAEAASVPVFANGLGRGLLPADHRLVGRRRLRAVDLRGEAFVILNRREAPGLYASLASAMGDAGGLGDDVLEVAEMQTIISLVAGGFGVSLVPTSVGSVDRSGVTFRPFLGPAPVIELAIAWRPATDSPVRNEFLSTARALAAVAERGTAGGSTR